VWLQKTGDQEQCLLAEYRLTSEPPEVTVATQLPVNAIDPDDPSSPQRSRHIVHVV
jgi:hypothetical protein